MVGKIAVQVYAPERRFCNVIDCFYLFYKLGNLFCFPFNIAPTCTTGSTPCPCSSRLCGSGRVTCCCSSTTSAGPSGPASPSPRRWNGCCSPTSGGAISGSCAMWWSISATRAAPWWDLRNCRPPSAISPPPPPPPRRCCRRGRTVRRRTSASCWNSSAGPIRRGAAWGGRPSWPRPKPPDCPAPSRRSGASWRPWTGRALPA